MKNPGLTYCTNVHPLGEWVVWSDLIGQFGPAIRDHLRWSNLPLGLWFPASFIDELNRDPKNNRERLNAFLTEKDLSVFTCNAFPFGNFHDKSVKTKVYHPDWTTPERLGYTVSVARLLAGLMPVGTTGSVSTLPLGWRMGWTQEHTRKSVENLCAFVIEARGIAEIEGRTIRLGLEPEPGCVLETMDQVIHFWDQELRPAAQRAGISSEDLNTYCGICYDTCHQAVQFEKAVEVLDRLHAQGIGIVKMQLSSALEFLPDPDRVTLPLRQQFVEERFLHQTRIQTPTGIVAFDDLPHALEAAAEPSSELWNHPWRVHFHLPIDSQTLLGSSAISTTRDAMLQAYHHALQKGLCNHFEIETYTWTVLPETHRPKNDGDLAKAIAHEMLFIAGHTPSGIDLNGMRSASAHSTGKSGGKQMDTNA